MILRIQLARSLSDHNPTIKFSRYLDDRASTAHFKVVVRSEYRISGPFLTFCSWSKSTFSCLWSFWDRRPTGVQWAPSPVSNEPFLRSLLQWLADRNPTLPTIQFYQRFSFYDRRPVGIQSPLVQYGCPIGIKAFLFLAIIGRQKSKIVYIGSLSDRWPTKIYDRFFRIVVRSWTDRHPTISFTDGFLTVCPRNITVSFSDRWSHPTRGVQQILRISELLTWGAQYQHHPNFFSDSIRSRNLTKLLWLSPNIHIYIIYSREVSWLMTNR